MKRISLFFTLLLVMLFAFAQTTQAQFLDGRNRIEFRVGAISHSFDTKTVIGTDGIQVSTGSSGVMTTFAYSKYIQENLAITFSISPIIADNGVVIDFEGIQTGTNTVTPIYLGARYYLFKSTYGKSMRPYLTAAAGPVVGSESGVKIGSEIVVGTYTETAFGAKFGLGIDFLLSSKFIIGFDSGYNVMSSFSQNIGSENNYSGADFSFGLSFLWGGK